MSCELFFDIVHVQKSERVVKKSPCIFFFFFYRWNETRLGPKGKLIYRQKKLYGIIRKRYIRIDPVASRQVAAIDDIIESEITGTQKRCVRGGRSLKVGPTRDPEVSPRINYRLRRKPRFLSKIFVISCIERNDTKESDVFSGTRSLITPIFLLLLSMKEKEKKKEGGDEENWNIKGNRSQ